MAARSPDPISAAELRRRRTRVLRLARAVGFVGRVEYRHVYSQTGGAQYSRGANAGVDLLTVYADAFDRDANPNDFSLAAIVAHERGHQLLARLAQHVSETTLAAEEVLASLIGALILNPGVDRQALVAKATAAVLAGGMEPVAAAQLIGDLWEAPERML
jgi:hypothetical protein